MRMYTLGIDVGASTVKLVALDAEGALAWRACEAHRGSPVACLSGMLVSLEGELPVGECAGLAVTGSGVEALQEAVGESHAACLSVLEEVPACTRGAAVLAPCARSIVQMGAQSSAFVAGLADDGAPRFALNDGCAAGTGAFFEDQMNRLGLPLADYSALVVRAQGAPRMSGRCSVFAKTDIIHLQQEGAPVEDILLGLCFAVVKSFKATIVRGLPVEGPVALAGGVVLNAGVVRAVREVFSLGEGELLAAPDNVYLQAVGAAAHAADSACVGAAASVSDASGISPAVHAGRAAGTAHVGGDGASALAELRAALGGDPSPAHLPRLSPLPPVPLETGAGFTAVARPWSQDEGGLTTCVLGVDVGSTSTNLVLLDVRGRLLDAQYLRTRGNPKQAVCEGLASLERRVGDAVRVAAVGVTGSGRAMIGRMVGADAVRDEITAQARAAAQADPQVDTVFEIGGQDSKYISLKGGQVADFQMNKVCAAGTGSFVEEQAARLGIPLADYGRLALSSAAPVDLGERCTVFMETAANAALARGASKADVAAGLACSVVRNYLNKVVAGRPVGQRVVLQGGVAYNPAIVAAFRRFWGDALTVSPWFAVSGAVGAALLALDECRQDEDVAEGEEADLVRARGKSEGEDTGENESRGRDRGRSDALSAGEPPRFRPTAFRGFDLAGEEKTPASAAFAADVAANRRFFRRLDDLFLEGYEPERDPAKKTVGVPRCLMLHKLFPMANAFFKELGYNVVLTDASDEDTVRLAQQYAQGETCYPVKLVHGHMAQLLDAGVDYVFMPSVHTIRHVKSTVPHNYACPYMQMAPKLIAEELGYEQRGIRLISPQLSMDFGQAALADAMLGVGVELGHTPQESARAMLAGGFAVMEFTRKTEALGDELLASLKPGERVMVLITRNYGIVDPALNMGIPDLLLDRGQKVITVSHLHAHDLDIAADYPGMYWPFGQHIISGAKLVRRDPRLFAVYLTNHGCGPDTMVSHLFAQEMGDKPYLHIEMDEHYSKVGVTTRVEAFLNAVEHYAAPDERAVPTSRAVVNTACSSLDEGAPCVLPSVGPYGPLAQAWLRKRGIAARAVAPTPASLALGKEATTTKEYYTFTSLAGFALAAAKEAAESAPAANELAAERAATEEALASERAAKEAAGEEAAAKETTASGVVGPLQVLLPSSEGGDADGQYDRVIRALLDGRGFGDVRVVAPSFERLPCAVEDVRGLFLSILAGDVAQAAPASEREQVLASFANEGVTFEGVCAAARRVGEGARAGVCAAENKRILVVGEWPLVVGDELTGDVWRRLEDAGCQVLRMPLAEYLWFIWEDGREEAAHGKVVGGPVPLLGETGEAVPVGLPDFPRHDCGGCASSAATARSVVDSRAAFEESVDPGLAGEDFVRAAIEAPAKPLPGPAQRPVEVDPSLVGHPLLGKLEPSLPQDEWKALLDDFAAQISQVAVLLGEASPFADDLGALRAEADRVLGGFRGSNGRYRAAKERLGVRRVDGVVAAASLYENTDVVLRLVENAAPAEVPVLRLSFDGVLDQSIDEKLNSFLYYL